MGRRRREVSPGRMRCTMRPGNQRGVFMINGAHIILYSKNAEADRNFFRDVLRWPHVDAGHGWLIFRLPPSELAFHPAEGGGTHELYFLCDNVKETIAELSARKIECSQITEERW